MTCSIARGIPPVFWDLQVFRDTKSPYVGHIFSLFSPVNICRNNDVRTLLMRAVNDRRELTMPFVVSPQQQRAAQNTEQPPEADLEDSKK